MSSSAPSSRSVGALRRGEQSPPEARANISTSSAIPTFVVFTKHPELGDVVPVIGELARYLLPAALRRHLRRLVHRRLHTVQARVKLTFHGSEYGGWAVADHLLGPRSTVYSVGIGEDISFDLSLIRTRGVTIHAFDPTPRSLRWLRTQSIPEKFVVHPYGLADLDGQLAFFPPADPGHASFSIAGQVGTPGVSVVLPVKRLSTIMEELNHDAIDLLKLDVEGAEYGVIRDLVSSGLRVKQVLVEFHHAMPQIDETATRESVALLNSAGFLITAISPGGAEYSFMHVDYATRH